ncbi:hypothetical protein [uncultured Parvibaculum sp.]|uniref:hypothetical protein n=1 Tax=uncultured Parvibaculum sp. TaxID=291828 RepID=UPI0030D8E1A4
MDDYLNNCAKCLERDKSYFESLPDLRTAIMQAGNGYFGPTKQIHSHQERIKKRKMPNGTKELLNLRRKNKILRCGYFEELYWIVCEVAGRKSSGLGPLWAYDVALRIWNFFGEPGPIERVYLQSGALNGHKNLDARLGNSIPAYVPPQRPTHWTTAKYAHVDDFPMPLRGLPSEHIENFLCLYADHL